MVSERLEVCENCGREWAAHWGSSFCRMRRVSVHENAIVVVPGAALLESAQRLTERLYREACGSAQSCDLAGEPSPYPEFLKDIDAAIGHLKRFRRELQGLAGHVHEWSDDDYCRICGADGRA